MKRSYYQRRYNVIAGRRNMHTKDLVKKYDEFLDATQNNGVLDQKTTTMLSLASSMAIGCYP
jgi:hypothetical protein